MAESWSTLLVRLRSRLASWADPGPTVGRVEFEQALTFDNMARLRVVAWVMVLAMPLIAAGEIRGLSALDSPTYWMMWRPVVCIRLCIITVAVAMILLSGRPSAPEHVRKRHQRWVVAVASTSLVLAALLSACAQSVRSALVTNLGHTFIPSSECYLLGVFVVAAFVQMSLRRILIVYLPGWFALVAGTLITQPLWVMAVPDIIDATLMLILAFATSRIAYTKAVNDYLNRRLVENQRAELEEANAQLATSNDLLRRISYLDPLMDIPNRRYFNEFVTREWRRAARDHTAVELLLVDVDHFKRYNDAYGHPAGDKCLIEVARAISGALQRSSDFLARFGGDEFAVVLPSTDLEGARHVAARILKAVNDLSIPHSASPYQRVTVSLGLDSWYPHRGGTADILIAGADQALYRAKAGGRGCIDVTTEQSLLNDFVSPAD